MTQNKMTVTHLWSGGKTWNVSGTGYQPDGDFYDGEKKVVPKSDKSLHQVLTFGLLCNHANLVVKDR